MRYRLREDDYVVANSVEYLYELIRDYDLDRTVFRNVTEDVKRNIVDTLTVVVFDHILYRIKEEGYEPLVRSFRDGRILTNAYINLKHLEIMFGSRIAEAIEYLGEQNVFYKYIRNYLLDIVEHPVYKRTFIEAVCNTLSSLSMYPNVPLKESTGSTITPDRMLIIFTRSTRHETYHVYSRNRERSPRPFGILSKGQRGPWRP